MGDLVPHATVYDADDEDEEEGETEDDTEDDEDGSETGETCSLPARRSRD